MVLGEFGPIPKVNRIEAKNRAAKQNSLSRFFGANGQGTRSNRAAFENYAIESESYSEKVI